MVLYEKRLHQLEEAEQKVANDLHEFYQEKKGIPLKATQSPSYISNKVLGGKSHVNAIGSKEAMSFGIVCTLGFLAHTIPEAYVNGEPDEFYCLDWLCEEYNRRHNTKFGRSK